MRLAVPEPSFVALVGGSDVDLGSRTDFAELSSVLAAASVAVAPNTGAAHLAAAVGTPVVSLFEPVVPAARWAPLRRASRASRRPERPVQGQTAVRGCVPSPDIPASTR